MTTKLFLLLAFICFTVALGEETGAPTRSVGTYILYKANKKCNKPFLESFKNVATQDECSQFCDLNNECMAYAYGSNTCILTSSVTPTCVMGSSYNSYVREVNVEPTSSPTPSPTEAPTTAAPTDAPTPEPTGAPTTGPPTRPLGMYELYKSNKKCNKPFLESFSNVATQDECLVHCDHNDDCLSFSYGSKTCILTSSATPTCVNGNTYNAYVRLGDYTPTLEPTSAPTTKVPTQVPTSTPTTFAPTSAPTNAPTRARGNYTVVSGKSGKKCIQPQLKRLKKYSLAECEIACDLNDQCVAISYTTGYDWCYLLSGPHTSCSNVNSYQNYERVGDAAPTAAPTGSPTDAPTKAPTFAPTKAPTTGAPTPAPTNAPTRHWGNYTLYKAKKKCNKPFLQSFSNVATQKDCRQHCDHNDLCEAFSYGSKTCILLSSATPTCVNGNTYNAYVRQGDLPVTSAPTASPTEAPTTGTPTQTPTATPTRYWGNYTLFKAKKKCNKPFLESFQNVATQKDCRQHCDLNDLCLAFSYGSKTCILLSSATPTCVNGNTYNAYVREGDLPVTAAPTGSPTETPTTGAPTTGSPTMAPTNAPTSSPTRYFGNYTVTKDSRKCTAPVAAEKGNVYSNTACAKLCDLEPLCVGYSYGWVADYCYMLSGEPTTCKVNQKYKTYGRNGDLATSAPTSAAPTSAPSSAPTSKQPTSAPTTSSPTDVPTTRKPTLSGETFSPTSSPTDAPTKAPTRKPTESGETFAPTVGATFAPTGTVIPDDADDDGLSGGETAGIVVGTVAGLGLIGLGVTFLMKKDSYAEQSAQSKAKPVIAEQELTVHSGKTEAGPAV